MEYKNYDGFSKTYVVEHNTGYGTMESNFEPVAVVFETDDLDVAKEKSAEFQRANNSKEDIESTWILNTYHINVNTLSVGGKALHKRFESKFKKYLNSIKDDPNFIKYQVGETTVYMAKWPEIK